MNSSFAQGLIITSFSADQFASSTPCRTLSRILAELHFACKLLYKVNDASDAGIASAAAALLSMQAKTDTMHCTSLS